MGWGPPGRVPGEGDESCVSVSLAIAVGEDIDSKVRSLSDCCLIRFTDILSVISEDRRKPCELRTSALARPHPLECSVLAGDGTQILRDPILSLLPAPTEILAVPGLFSGCAGRATHLPSCFTWDLPALMLLLEQGLSREGLLAAWKMCKAGFHGLLSVCVSWPSFPGSSAHHGTQ